jgi:dipeptidyl aminopeptidase/acylaminoacyl peptidase
MAGRRRAVRLDDLFKLHTPLQPALSPDGQSLLFVRRRMNLSENRYESNLWWLPTTGGTPRQLTRGTGRDTEPAWHPQGGRIAYVRQPLNQPPQIWILPLEGGGEPWPLTALSGGPIRDLQWSPDGAWILFNHRRQPRIASEDKQRRPAYKHITQLQHKLDGDGFFPPEHWHLFRIRVRRGRANLSGAGEKPGPAEQLTRGPQNDTHGVWSPDGRHIAFVSNRIPDADLRPDNDDLYVMTAGGRGARKITRRFGPVSSPAWSLDGSALYYIGHFGQDGEWIRHRHHIYRVECAGGQVRDLTPQLDNWPFQHVAGDTVPSGASFLHVYREAPSSDHAVRGRTHGTSADGEERIAFVINEHGASRLYSIAGNRGRGQGSRRGGRERTCDPRCETAGRVNVYAAHGGPSLGRMVVAASRMLDAGDLYNVELNGSGSMHRLTTLNRQAMASWILNEPQEVLFGGTRNKNVPVHGWILKPPGFRSGRRYPLVLNIHGGPMAQYGYSFFHEMHYLAAQGYVVVFTNPRGSSGYGLGFMNCIENNWGKLDYDDLMAVVDQMVRKPYIDGRRLGVLGGSYGGFMTTWIVGHTQRFRAAVTQRQVGNVMTQAGSSDLGFYRILSRKSFPWETPMRYLRDSANFYAHQIRTPLLIIHSEDDLRCPIAQGEELFTLLKMQRRTVEMVRFEGESHGLSRGGRPQNRRERLRRIADWFARYL